VKHSGTGGGHPLIYTYEGEVFYYCLGHEFNNGTTKGGQRVQWFVTAEAPIGDVRRGNFTLPHQQVRCTYRRERTGFKVKGVL
jgi:hypothetical protein